MPPSDPAQRLAELTAALESLPADELAALPGGAAELAAGILEREAAGADRELGVSDRGPEGMAVPATLPLTTGFATRLDLSGFGLELVGRLQPATTGFALRVIKPGQPGLSMWSGDAQQPGDGDRRWNGDVRMHVASVSKLVTAMAMTRLLGDAGISPDDRIVGYLPHYWPKGVDVEKVTFAQLFTHRSGFFNAGDSDSNFGQLKAQIGRGVYWIGQYRYENTNFSICRVLLATILGEVSPAMYLTVLSEDDNDLLWDHLSVAAYRRYVQDVVLAPSGLVGPTLTHPSDHALAYDFPTTMPGWNSGDRTETAGGDGWHLSATELAHLLHQFRREATVVPRSQAEEMLRRGFGVDWAEQTTAGWIYGKSGYWRSGSGQVEQAVAFFLPDDTYVALLVNSPLGAADASLLQAVRDAFVAHLVPEDEGGRIHVDPTWFPQRPGVHEEIDPGARRRFPVNP